MTKHIKYISVMVLGGLALTSQAHAAVINWTSNFTDTSLNTASEVIVMFEDPIMLLVGLLCAVIGIGAIIGYLKH